MKRHPFNVFSFGFGVVLILLAVGLVVPDELEFSRFATVRWLLPLAMVLVGVSMLSSLFRRRERDADPAEATTGTHGEDEPEEAAETESASG